MKFRTVAKTVLQRIVHNKTLKKLKSLRSLLRWAASMFVKLLNQQRGLKFPSKWDWYPKLEFLLGLYEPGTTLLCKKLAKSGMRFIDVGANIGYYTLLFSKLVGPNGKIYAFEPAPEIFQLLKHNVRNKSNVVLEQKAVSNNKGKVEFALSTRTRSHSFFVPHEFIKGFCKIETLTLDDFLDSQGLKHCDFIKIDIEGAEPLVLEGMANLLQQAQNLLIICEFSPSALQLAGVNDEDFLRTLYSKFNKVLKIDENVGALVDIDVTNLASQVPKGKSVNLLCCKGDLKL